MVLVEPPAGANAGPQAGAPAGRGAGPNAGSPAAPGATSIDLRVDGTVDLRPYATEGFQLRLDTGGLVPYADVQVTGEMRLHVNPT